MTPGRFSGLSRGRMAGLLALGSVGIIVLSLVLLGIPGALWLMAGSPVARLFTGTHAAADRAWPMAILHSMIWPVFLPVAYLLVAARAVGRRRVVWTLVVTGGAALVLAVAMQVGAGVVS